MQQSARNRKKKKKESSVFDASHFEESDGTESSGIERRQVRFKRASTPPRSSRTRTSKPIARYLSTPWILSLLSLLSLLIFFTIVPVTAIGFSHHIVPYVNAALNLSETLIDTISSSRTRTPEARIPPHIAEYVQRAISTALKNTLQRPDFALRSRGAIVVPSLSTTPLEWSCDVDDVLDEDLDPPRPCCFFTGDRGQVAIRLSQLIRPLHLTVDYTPPARTMSHHAPRQLVLWGLVDGAANKAAFKSLAIFRDEHRSLGDGPPQSGRFTFLPIANVTFDIRAGFPVQTFPIHSEIVFSGISSGLYVLEMRSNWGGNSTGICRVGLHGEEV